MFDRMTAAAQEMEAALAELDPQSMIGSQPATGLELLGRHERAVAAARSALTARAAEMNQWQRQGFRSFEDWYAATFGTSFGQAKRKAKAAKNLDGNDRTARALADGEISEDEADVVADAAAKNPDAEKELLDTARNKNKSHNDLKDKAAKAKAAGESDRARADRLRRGRRGGWGTDRDGFWTMSGKFQPQVGAELKSRLDAEVDRIFARTRKAGQREPLDRYRADALAALILGYDPDTGPDPAADSGSAAGTADRTNGTTDTADNTTTGATGDTAESTNRAAARDVTNTNEQGEPGEPHLDFGTPTTGEKATGGGRDRTDGPSDRPPTDDPAAPTGSGRVGKELVLDINLETLRRGCVNPGETCTIRGVGQVPVEVARQWVDDAFIKAVIRDGTDVKSVVHYGRHIPAHLRTALDLTGPTCAVPHCDNPRVEYDHHQPFAAGGATSWTNLRPACDHHHDQITYEGYALEGQTGAWRWLAPDGRVLSADNPEPVDTPERAP